MPLLGGPNHTYFTYDGASGRLTRFMILRVLRMIMASAVLGEFSVVLRAVGGPSGASFSCSWGPSGSLGGFQDALETSCELSWGSLARFRPPKPTLRASSAPFHVSKRLLEAFWDLS